ncbi:hypothetical protein WR25_02999 [Diploscapter pachys]|uniref:Uncharacterized protein n=1 Tax=Diploscapter pachys TaxID=2018661 RepID=A0A2A2M2B9_9BILA|nr:hypothetical protein WR25_02999 [Diploscapter pachys]
MPVEFKEPRIILQTFFLKYSRSVDVSHGSRRVAFSPTVSLRADSHQAPSSSADTRQAIDTHSSLAGKDIHSDVAPFERDSALKVVWNSISNVITKGTAITHKRRPVPLRICKSFDIEQIEPETAAGGAGQGQGPRSAATTPHIIAGLRSPFSMSSRHYRDQHEQFEMSTLNADGRAHLATVSETEEGEAEPISRRGSERKEDEDAGLQMEVKKEREAQERRVAVAVASYADWPMMDMNENDAEEEIELHGGGLADTARPSNLRMSGRPLSKKTQSKPKDGGPKQIVKFYDSQYPVEFETSVPFMKDEEDDLINERFFDSGVSKKEQTITIGYTARDGGEENEAGMEEEPKTRIPRTGRERFPIEMRESMLPKKPIRLGPSPIIRHQPNGIPDRPDVVHTRSDIDQQLEIVKNRVKNILMSQQPRRTRGISKFGQLCGQKLRYKKVRKLRPELRNQIEQGEGERPFFTWWVTTVQIVVCLISILAYGFGPVGLSRKEMKKEVSSIAHVQAIVFMSQVQDVTLSYRQVSYYEPSNIWFGPRFSDLIRLGAKYSPCMRREKKLWDVITMVCKLLLW